MRPHSALVAALALVLLYFFALAAFGGQAPLGPHENLRHEFAPYNLAKLNYLGLNYCENLLD
jgi:HAMP domain-containing protein